MRKSILLSSAIFMLLQAVVLFCLTTYNREEITSGDASHYLLLGKNYPNPGGFSKPDITRLPLYPWLIAKTSTQANNYHSLIFMQHAMVAIMMALLCVMMRRTLWPDNKLTVLFMIVFMIDLIWCNYSNRILTEIPFVFLYFVSLLPLFKVNEKPFLNLGMSGVFQCLAMLTRPILIFWPVLQGGLLAIYFWRNSRNMGQRRSFCLPLLLYGVMAYAGIGYWTWQNAQVNGYTGLPWISQVNLYHHKAALVAVEAGMTDSDSVHEYLDQQLENKRGKNLSLNEKARAYRDLTRQMFREHPGIVCNQVGRSLRRLFLQPGLPELVPKEHALRSGYNLLKFLQLILNGAILVMCLWGLRGLLKEGLLLDKTPQAFVYQLFTVIIIYFTLFSTPGADARFRLPMAPALYGLAITGLTYTKRFSVNR